MDNSPNQNPVLLFMAWLNYIISYALSDNFLNKVALLLSILGSIVYVYTSLDKHFKNKRHEKTN